MRLPIIPTGPSKDLGPSQHWAQQCSHFIFDIVLGRAMRSHEVGPDFNQLIPSFTTTTTTTNHMMSAT
jgi:hypothetical protein